MSQGTASLAAEKLYGGGAMSQGTALVVLQVAGLRDRFERARLQPCRECPKINAGFSRRGMYSLAPPGEILHNLP
jgi:hypothetical protein